MQYTPATNSLFYASPERSQSKDSFEKVGFFIAMDIKPVTNTDTEYAQGLLIISSPYYLLILKRGQSVSNDTIKGPNILPYYFYRVLKMFCRGRPIIGT